jgi:energy-coupling factor transport system substrate-specific component
MRSHASRSRSWRETSCRCAARSARTIGAGSRSVVTRPDWFGACGYIYLWRDSGESGLVSMRLLVLIPVAAAISLALSAAVDAVALPLFLDTTGTILATALGGPVVGISTGVVTSAVNSLRNPTFWPFVAVQVIVALYAWMAARAGLFRSFKTAVPAGFGLGVIAAFTSTPISYLIFGCTTTGGIALTTALGKALGLPPLGACFFGSFLADFGDKAVTFALVTSVLHGLPRRTAARFPWALRAIGAA